MKCFKQIIQELMNFRNIKLYIFCIILGALVSPIIICFRWLLNEIQIYRTAILQSNQSIYIHISLVVIMWIIAMIIYRFSKKFPLTSGSGIPETTEIATKHLRLLHPLINLIVKFIGGIVSIGMGFSLSRGGPAVEMGSFIGGLFRKSFNKSPLEQRRLEVVTGGAGLAAAFTTPLAATLFVIEGITHKISSKMTVSLLLATGTAGWIALVTYPNNLYQSIDVSSPAKMNMIEIAVSLFIFAIFVAVLGKIFNMLLLRSQSTFNKIKLPLSIKILIAVLSIYFVGAWVPNLIADGEPFLLSERTTSISIMLIFLFIIIKILITTISYAPGFPGGIFLPLLVIGGLTGEFYGMVMAHFGFCGQSIHYGFFMILGMAGFFAASVRTPVTAIIFTIEITRQFGAFFPSIIFVGMTYFISQLLSTKPIYTALYNQLIGDVQSSTPPHKSQRIDS